MASKSKTPGSNYKPGGPSSMDRKKYGRNMAVVLNQRGTRKSARGK